MLLYSPWRLSSASGKEHNEDTQYSGGGVNRRQAQVKVEEEQGPQR